MRGDPAYENFSRFAVEKNLYLLQIRFRAALAGKRVVLVLSSLSRSLSLPSISRFLSLAFSLLCPALSLSLPLSFFRNSFFRFLYVAGQTPSRL